MLVHASRYSQKVSRNAVFKECWYMYPGIHKKSVGMQYLKNVGTCIPAFTKVSKNAVFKECWYMYPSIHKKSVGMQYYSP